MSDRETEARVRGAVARAIGRDASSAPVRRLAGHASMRSYWRVGAPSASGSLRDAGGVERGVSHRPSYVVMVLPPDAKPEEVTKGGSSAVDPFVNVRRFLAELGARVPELVAFFQDDPRGGLMVLEDLGDVTLEDALRAQVQAGEAGPGPQEAPKSERRFAESADLERARGQGREADPQEVDGREPAASVHPPGWTPLYERAVDQLAWIRVAAEHIQAQERDACIAFTRAFDHELYLWELHHFREWLLEAWKGASLSPAERAVVDREFERIARALDAEPKGFTHRDYQSRNLMVLPSGEQAVIDFQDALLGPRQYDLVALLRDSYVELPPDLVDRMISRYLEKLASFGGPRLERGPFREVFDLLTVQRKLKDAGRFVFIDRVKKNPGFLPSIPASLRYVRDAFGRRPDLADLQEILARHVPELAR